VAKVICKSFRAYSSGTVLDFHPVPFSSFSPDEGKIGTVAGAKVVDCFGNIKQA
jgi:hypothetical protein